MMDYPSFLIYNKFTEVTMKEMWDLYDKNRNPLNKKVLRGTVLSDDE